MRDFAIVFVHLIVTLARLARPGGLRSVVAESVLVRHQLLILNRGRKRAPNLRATDRIIAGLFTVFMRPARVLRSAIVLKPSTLLHLHSVLCNRKYRMLFSPRHRRRPGPKGPNKDLIEAVVAMKRRNPGWGCPRIAQQISLAFGVEIDKDVVRRVLSVHYRPESDSGGPSCLTFLGHTKDSLWTCDLFRCESATLRTHWVLVVMDHFTRRIIGFGVHRVREIKTVPYVPVSHPFVERLIGTVRREYLDRILFWTTADLETKLLDFQHYFNAHRTHAGLDGRLPEPDVGGFAPPLALGSYRWQKHCRGLYQTPIAA